ncbi:hypothetical protein GCM10011363_46480 [Marivita lacus]|uniref:Uncharacterized protein n=1 Tax=Marivita lacus TaxID=1323742 RepID=A0ABQ1LNI9_9RHOB|nr:hypothetical protein [Marivita lacus]GGC24739.1 hypothetical protein GCM10011363_46480 [Marivita lacus]
MLGPVQEVEKNFSGSDESVALRRLGTREQVIATKAALALATCGIPLLTAKRAVEHVIDEGEETLILPMVSTRQDLSRVLAAAGIDVVFGYDVGSCQL